MYGVPTNLPLSPFLGDTLEQVRLSEHQLQLHFRSAGSINIEGRWELSDSFGNLIDHTQEHNEREAYKVHLLLGQSPCAFKVNSPQSFSLQFSSGYALTVFDDSQHYESFSVVPSNAPSVHV